jgi:FkbH-like protein
MIEGLPQWLSNSSKSPCESDYILFNNASELPDEPPRPITDYNFQLVQIPLRSVVYEHQLYRLAYDDIAGYEAFFEACATRLQQIIDAALTYNEAHGILTFVVNMLVPQTDQLGRLMPRIDLRNSAYFIRKLNDLLAAEVDRRSNVYLLDVDAMSAALGRSTVQDDSICITTHGSALSDWDVERDASRIEAPVAITETVPNQGPELLTMMWKEAVAMFRTIHQVDAVKLVIIDLDDTLWRGVVAENGEVSTDTTEGWPNGFSEALMALKRRGILLAIVSKNTEKTIRKVWSSIFQEKLFLEDFAAIKINWDPKADNVEAIFHEVNVLPSSVVFIDDNPVERAAVQGAFPEIRVLGQDPYQMRRILLWSSETQVATITNESGKRTEMVQAQIKREGLRSKLTRKEFLKTLKVVVSVDEINNVSHDQFARAFELVNKSNQFNSSGERWTREQATAFFLDKGKFVTFTVRDSFTGYGLTAVAITKNGEVQQFVMSCRVLGLDVEKAIFEYLKDNKHNKQNSFKFRYVKTPENSLVLDALKRNGFKESGEWWSVPSNKDFEGTATLEKPKH